MWAVGCIFAELLTLKPLFQGQEVKANPNPFQVSCRCVQHFSWLFFLEANRLWVQLLDSNSDSLFCSLINLTRFSRSWVMCQHILFSVIFILFICYKWVMLLSQVIRRKRNGLCSWICHIGNKICNIFRDTSSQYLFHLFLHPKSSYFCFSKKWHVIYCATDSDDNALGSVVRLSSKSPAYDLLSKMLEYVLPFRTF